MIPSFQILYTVFERYCIVVLKDCQTEPVNLK